MLNLGCENLNFITFDKLIINLGKTYAKLTIFSWDFLKIGPLGSKYTRLNQNCICGRDWGSCIATAVTSSCSFMILVGQFGEWHISAFLWTKSHTISWWVLLNGYYKCQSNVPDSPVVTAVDCSVQAATWETSRRFQPSTVTSSARLRHELCTW